MAVILRFYPEIVNRMIAVARSESDLTDFAPGSATRTILEAAALQDADQYIQLSQIEDLFSIDTASGEELDKRAEDYAGLVEPRLASTQSFGTVTIGDDRVTKKIEAALTGAITPASTVIPLAVVGATVIGDFPLGGGLVILERDTTGQRESVPYTSRVGNNLNVNLGDITLSHGIGTSVILSQQGVDAAIPALTTVTVPATVDSIQVDFETTTAVILRDGDAIVLVNARSKLPGADKNVADGQVVSFQSAPFPNATVTNDLPFAGGRDRETDDELRSRIKNTVLAFAGSTKIAIEIAAANVQIATGQRVVTAQLVEPVVPGDQAVLYIDDGTGFIPSTVRVEGPEVVVQKAEPGQRRAQLLTFPILETTVRLFKSVQHGIQPVGAPSITVSGNTLTDITQTFNAPLGDGNHRLFDANRKEFTITALGPGANTVTLSGSPTQPIAGENFFIINTAPASLLTSVDVSIDHTTGAIEFIGTPLVLGQGVVAHQEGNSPLAPAYQFFDGLIQEVQKVVNGVPSDPFTYPGKKGAGARVFVTTPQIVNVNVSLGISAPPDVSEDTIRENIRLAIVSYINSLGIGEDVIVAEIIRVSQEAGAADSRMLSPTSNIIILEGQLARTALAVVAVT